MIFTLEWLKEHLSTEKNTNEIVEKLNHIGLEVENTLPSENVFDKIVIAEILECDNHPDSDHLHVCKVSDGKEIYQIVCGAPNARKGIKVALALIGAYIPNGDFKIKKSKIRGVDSCGMMCSEREMGIGNDHDGIMELPSDCKLGELWVKEYKALEKMPIEVSITPNRGDATSIYGIARDLNAGNFGILEDIKTKIKKQTSNIKETIKNTKSVNVKIDDCLYFCREIKGLNLNVETPKYILKRNALNGCGDNGIIVNILNYIMFEYGQPMHSYDTDKIGKKIIVDYAKNDTFTTLKGEEIKYDKNKILMVSDENKDLCIAGIMGGNDCKTTNETKNIMLECAYFPTEPITIGGQLLKIVSDARFRYERGINPDLTKDLLNLATSMIVEICGGEVSNIEFSGELKKEKIINYRLSATEKILGFKVSMERVIEILEKLQFEIIEKNNEKLTIKIPRFRHDVEIEADIAEEIGRIEGYDKIPNLCYKITNNFIKNNFEEKLKIKKFLSQNDITENISMAFCNENKAKLFAEINNDLKLSNPISNDYNYMRPTLLISLLQSIKTNENSIIENQLAFFEEGMIFSSPKTNGQHNSVAVVYYGSKTLNDYFKQGREFDIFDAKKTLFELLQQIYNINTENLKIEKCSKQYVHPTRSFDVKIKDKDGENNIAIFGEISPFILKQFDIKHSVCFFEMFIDKIPNKKQKKEKFIVKNIQPIIRDIAFIVDENITANQLTNAYKNEILTNVSVIDIFKMNNKKSIALRYLFEPKENMTIEQINDLMNKIIISVENKTGGKVRDGK